MAGQYSQLKHPSGGVVRRMSYQDHREEYTTPSASNWRSDDPILGRERGGTRAALASAFTGGSANPVRLITECRYVDTGTLVSQLLVSSGGTLYKENGSSLSSVGTGLASGNMLTAANHLGKVYIGGGAAIQVYNPAAGGSVGAISASAGTAPTNCRLVCNYLDRLVAAGDTSNPQQWYMSKTGDATNWDYTVTDYYGAAVSSTTATQQLNLVSPITALIPHSDGCLIFGCIDAMVILQGDPLQGGKQSDLSPTVGCLGPGAWCYTPEGYLFFMSTDGLYVAPPGCDTRVKQVSRDRLPEELVGLNIGTHEVCMAYDLRFQGIHLMVSPRSTGTSYHYWVDVTTTSEGSGGAIAAFWPMAYQASHEPFAMYARNATAPSSATLGTALFGGRDGVVRRQDASASTDDGSNAITWHVDYGPLAIAKSGYDGMLTQVNVTMAASSSNATLAVRGAQTAEGAFNASNFDTKTVSAGLNNTFRPQMRCASACIKLSGTGRVAVESINIDRRQLGELRKR